MTASIWATNAATATADTTPILDGGFGSRNKIINGAMIIDQRNEGTAKSIATTVTTYTLDRWAALGQAAAGVFSVQRLSGDGPDGGYYARLKVTTIDAAPTVGSKSYLWGQRLEGFNTIDLQLGMSGAKFATISFYVRSSIAGIYCMFLIGGAPTRSYRFSVTVNNANTWELKTFTIQLDTQVGITWAIDNTTSFAIFFSLWATSLLAGSLNIWETGNFQGFIGQSSALITTLNSTIDFAQFQMERGQQMSGFENRLYGQQLLLCQRYYEKSFTPGVVPAQNAGVSNKIYEGGVRKAGAVLSNFGNMMPYSVQKRTLPTLTLFNPSAANAFARNITAATDATTTASAIANTDGFVLNATGLAGWAAGDSVAVHWTSDADL